VENQNSKHVNPLREIIDPFINLVKAPRALWGVNIPYIIEGLVYFGILTILGKYCSENVALSDLHAGWIYGGVTGGITLSMLFLGGVSDKIGIGRSLALSLFIMMIGRLIVSLSGTLGLDSGLGSPMFYVMISGLFMMVVAYGLYQPAAYAGVKRYTTPKTSAMGYAVIYALMNLGAFLSGFISPLIRHNFVDIFPPNGLTAVFWVYTILTLLALLGTLFILSKKADNDAVARVKKEISELNSADSSAEDDSALSRVEKKNNKPFYVSLVLVGSAVFLLILSLLGKVNLPLYTEYIVLMGTIIWSVWEFLKVRPEHPFRDKRFVFFIFLLIPVQTLFAHNWLTIPYYLDRAFVGTFVGEYFEFFSNLNPVLIFFLAPIIAALTYKSDIYKMMILGTFVMAVPTFLLAVGPNAYLFLIYILIMTVGEAMWQPRFLQWIADIAPKGKTGAYMGIGQFPWVLTKLMTSMYSGYFIANYVPKPDSGMEMRTGDMWLFYAVIAMITPIALWLARNWMKKTMMGQAE
jgi:MFS family permease